MFFFEFERPLSGKADVQILAPGNRRLTTALPPEAAIRLILLKWSANDPLVFPRFSGQLSLVLMSASRTRLD